ncbi:hypothetical protein BU17DRAFT_85740 [Hysterangium stoloniferum]|nr:hypothetical protein BU17DRAFT_85740 [Hysterangium stoloniferum]
MSSSAGSNALSIPDHFVGLVLLDDEDSPFYLQIPLDTIESLCLKPRKYLRYLAWSILGVEGSLALESDGDSISTDGDLYSGGIYYYITNTNSYQAVDLEVIKMRTSVPSEPMQTRNEFCTNLLERDGFFEVPKQWFQLIVGNRPNYSEDVGDLDDINDIRNGVFANPLIHHVFDSRDIAILKTPNRYRSTSDIPLRNKRPNMMTSITYTTNSRYTLQWLNLDDLAIHQVLPDNRDAAFMKGTKKPKPSDLLLHYNYGAAAPPRPPVPVPAPSGPLRTTHDRMTVINKLHAAWAASRSGAGNAAAGPSTAGAATEEGELVDSKGQPKWDEDDVMLFFWGNSQAAREHHDKKVQENSQRMEQWREGVPKF